MTTAIFIMGTNCTGKSTLARELIAKHGGIARTTRLCTYTADNTAFVGDYSSGSPTACGVDKLGGTRLVFDAVEEAFVSGCDTVVAEGMLLGTFGLNVLKALFYASQPVVVFLFAAGDTLARRLEVRSGKHMRPRVVKRQNEINRAVAKYKEVGCKVLRFNTEVFSPSDMANHITGKTNTAAAEYEI